MLTININSNNSAIIRASDFEKALDEGVSVLVGVVVAALVLVGVLTVGVGVVLRE